MVAPALRLVVFGGFGRMGREVVALAEADAEITLCGIADQKTSLETLKSYKPNVVIEFSSVEGVKKISQWCAQNKVALVSGTTGLDKPNEESLKTYAKKAPVFRSANMSIGINALAKVIREFAKNFPNSDVQVEEIHHKHKKDNPSGTALFRKAAQRYSVYQTKFKRGIERRRNFWDP
jgi:4-hydroxy-tetrahydrodipicolinate reductase